MTYEEKQELVERIEEEYGVDELFKEIGFEKVKKHGGNIYSVCPFHQGADNPNGFAYSNKFGYCFTHCHEKLDLYNIIMKHLNMTFPEAVEFLADKVGMSVSFSNSPKVTKDSQENREFLSQRRRIKKMKSNVVEIKPIDEHIFLDIEPLLHTMLRREGFDNETREYFGLGYARSGFFEDRITIPIDYMDGSIISMSGRSVLSDEELEEFSIKRYKILFDTDKSLTLYNLSRALPYIEITKEVILVEGFKSVWRLHQWGIRNVVATMGSSLADTQKRILLKLGCKIFPCGDRDEAGAELNEQIKRECGQFSDVEIIDMFLLDVDEKSSIDNITKEQFDFIYNNRK